MRTLLTLLVATVSAMTVAVVAEAAPPEHFPWEEIDESFTIPAAPDGPCAYAIQVNVSGKSRHTHFFDGDGNEVRNLTIFPTLTVTFSANGKSVSTVSPATEHITINPDGSALVTITGLGGHLIVGGQPPLAADVGRIVFYFSGPTDEEPDVLFVAGPMSGGPFPALCAVLAP